MALDTTIPDGFLQISPTGDAANIVFGTVALGDDYGEVKSCSVKRAVDQELVKKANLSLLAVILSNPRFEMTMKVIFQADDEANVPDIGDPVVIPLAGVSGQLLGWSVDWEENGHRQLSLEVTHWDSIGSAPTVTAVGAAAPVGP